MPGILSVGGPTGASSHWRGGGARSPQKVEIFLPGRCPQIYWHRCRFWPKKIPKTAPSANFGRQKLSTWSSVMRGRGNQSKSGLKEAGHAMGTQRGAPPPALLHRLRGVVIAAGARGHVRRAIAVRLLVGVQGDLVGVPAVCDGESGPSVMRRRVRSGGGGQTADLTGSGGIETAKNPKPKAAAKKNTVSRQQFVLGGPFSTDRAPILQHSGSICGKKSLSSVIIVNQNHNPQSKFVDQRGVPG